MVLYGGRGGRIENNQDGEWLVVLEGAEKKMEDIVIYTKG